MQSIMQRFWMTKTRCPNCDHKWTESSKMSDILFNLKKVDFFWLNRDQQPFNWFVDLLSQLELEQAEQNLHNKCSVKHFLEMHMYVTSGLQRHDMRAVTLNLALDLLYKKEKRDLITGLKSRTKYGRPQWDAVFAKLKEENKGPISVFYCGNPALASTLRKKCLQFGFSFFKEVF